MTKKETENNKIKYKPYSIRMDDRTWKKLCDIRIVSGKSWNRFLLELMNKKKIK